MGQKFSAHRPTRSQRALTYQEAAPSTALPPATVEQQPPQPQSQSPPQKETQKNTTEPMEADHPSLPPPPPQETQQTLATASSNGLPSPPPSPSRPAPLQQRHSLVSRLFGSKRPSLELNNSPLPISNDNDDDELSAVAVPQPIAQVPMQRCSVTTHLRPSFVTAMGLLPRTDSKVVRRRSTALHVGFPRSVSAPSESAADDRASASSSSDSAAGSASLPYPPPPPQMRLPLASTGIASSSSPIVSPIASVSSRASLSSSSGSLSDDELSVDAYGSSSSSDDDLLGDEEEIVEVNDWLEEPEDAVLTPKHHGSVTTGNRQNRSFSSASSSSTTRSRTMGQGGGHSHSMTGLPSASSHGSITTTASASGPHHQRPSIPNSSATSLSAWLSGQEEPDDDYLDDEYESANGAIPLTDFMRENMPVYEVMKQVQLFRNLSQTQQEQVLRALKPAKFQDGEIIVQQGTRGSRFYMIAKGEAVVTKKCDGDDQERMVTHLHPGHYFGELALIYDDPRTATVRAEGDVELLYLCQEDFQRIGQVHLSLMLQQVPLLAQLNARDQDIVLSRLKPANFNDGEYIVRQGEQGTRFYMITRGEAIVSEQIQEGGVGKEKELTRLYEGHVFGEMALIYSEPRTASVRAVGPVKCLYLSKEDFDKCLLSERFHRFIQKAYVEKATRRAMRLKVQQRANSLTPSSTVVGAGPTGAGQSVDGGAATGPVPPPPGLQHQYPPAAPLVRATETKKVVRRLKDGQKVVNKYVIKGDLGKGTFGRVKLCQNEEDGNLYAVKIMHKTFVQRMAGKEDQLQDVLRREVAIMKKLDHQNVVKLVEVIDDPSCQKMYLVQEYVQHNLMDQVQKSAISTLPQGRSVQTRTGLSEEVARKYTRDLLNGLHYLHFHKVIHRDIKPENILVSADGVAKIADFGTARMIMNESETISGAKGTPAFMAPEMFDVDAKYMGPSVDVWSLGATLYMMVIGVPPWLADNEILLAEKVQHDELTFPGDVERTMEPHLKNLLQRMLTKNPKLRITLNECLTHDWITKEGSEPLVVTFGSSSASGSGTGVGVPGTAGTGFVGATAVGASPAREGKILTVSLDESERAIQNIPERIDLSLSEFLEQAHLLVKTRQQTGGSNQSLIHRTSSGGSQSASWAPAAGNSNTTGPAGITMVGDNRSGSSTSSSPSRATLEDSSRIIRAWRQHKRVQLMYGHKELSEKSRELLLEQKRVAFSADRAKVTEIILPTTGPQGMGSSMSSMGSTTSGTSTTGGRIRNQSSNAALLQGGTTSAMAAAAAALSPRTRGPLSPGRERHFSSPNMTGSSSRGPGELLSKTSNSNLDPAAGLLPPLDEPPPSAEGLMTNGLTGFGRTSFTSVSGMSDISGFTTDDNPRDTKSDADLMKRSLSRKKDFLMVTSEVFRDEDGDFQSRKILFQARDHDFSVSASRVPPSSAAASSSVAASSTTSSGNSKSSRELARSTSSQLKKNGSRRSMTSNFSMDSMGSNLSHASSASSAASSSTARAPAAVAVEGQRSGGGGVGGTELDLDGLDCVLVTEDDDDDEMEDVEEEEEDKQSRRGSRSSALLGGRRSSLGLKMAEEDEDLEEDGLEDSEEDSDEEEDSDNSEYSDVEGDVDVDETFNDLIGGTANQLELGAEDDEEILPMADDEDDADGLAVEGMVTLEGTLEGTPLEGTMPCSSSQRQLVQVYVSSKIRENLVLGVRTGYAEAKGSRSYMEDKSAVMAACNLDTYSSVTQGLLSTTFTSLAYFAVYDGHNGDETAKFLQSELHHRFFQHPQFVENPKTTITQVCEMVDDEILENQSICVLPVASATPKRKRSDDQEDGTEEGEDMEEPPPTRPKLGREESEGLNKPLCQPISFSGSAAVFTVITCRPSDQKRVVYVANIGDCRAVLCTSGGLAVDLTVDHKASNESEKKRIEASGGFVHNGRLDGILALSRGFGDFAHKNEGHLVATPDVYEHVVGGSDEFILLASDGLFDVLSSQQAVNFIYRKLRLHGDVQLAAQEMVLKAQQYFAHDNISVIIIALNQQTTETTVENTGGVAVSV